jgi:hypothetical protein
LSNNTEKDWTGNKNSIFKTLGASNHTDKERQNEDYYATDPIGIDFLTYNQPWNGDILTNPPYKYAKEFIEHAMTLIPDGCRVFMFLKVQFLEGKARKELFKKYPPKCVYVSSSRILCAKNALFDEMRAGGGSAVAYAWYEFEKGYTGESKLKWIN